MAIDYKEKAKEVRRKVLEMIHQAGTSHIASNFSIIDVATVLYANLKPKDEVVWSAGWKSATIYYFLAQQGKIPKEDLEIFGKAEIKKIPCVDCKNLESEYIPDFGECYKCEGVGYIEKEEVKYLGLAETSIPGVLCNGGSMGHGLPIACGMALAKKLKGEEGKIYCIMSDGELNEGTTWESAMFASHHKLDNLVVIVDKNKWQAMGKCEEVLNVNPEQAFEGFGWGTDEIDGHDFKKIENRLGFKLDKNQQGIYHWRYVKLPKVLVCNTTKGKGVSFMENHLLFHYKHVDENDYARAFKELI